MVTKSVTEQPAHRNRPPAGGEASTATTSSTRHNFRCKRGVALYKRFAHKIRNTAPWTYLVPSQSGSGIYLVYMKEGEESCSCPDYAKHHDTDEDGNETFLCKHYFAARLWKAKSAECAACGARYPKRRMKEAGEDHMIFHAGDCLCHKCAANHGLGEVA